MEPIHRTLRRASAQEPERIAAQIVSAVTLELRTRLQATEADLRAVSYKNGTVLVEVAHPAMAAKIRLLESSCVPEVNNKLRLPQPGWPVIQRLRTKITVLQ